MNDFDGQASDAIERGMRNRFVMELAANHCSHMDFWQGPHFGIGLLEQAMDLPIGMRSVECRHVSGGRTFAAADFEPMALDFFEKHCVGCKFQNPNGRFPTLGALSEERKAEQAEAVEAQQQAERESQRFWATRAERRRAMRLDGNAATVSLSRDLDLIDPDPSLPAADSLDARLRIEAVASRAPELFTDSVVDVLFEMVIEVPGARTLEPLRLLGRSKTALQERLLAKAFERLSFVHDNDAGRCVVELKDHVTRADLTPEVRRSIILLAGAPTQGSFGHFEESTAREVEPLLIAARIAPELLTETIETMLPGPDGPPVLELSHQAQGHRASKVDAWRESVDRAAAASALDELLASHRELALGAFDVLASNVLRSGDPYDDHPRRTVTRVAARMIIVDLELLQQLVAKGVRLGEDDKEKLFEIIDEVAKTFGPYRGRPMPVEPADEQAVLSSLLSLQLNFLMGDGERPSSQLLAGSSRRWRTTIPAGQQKISTHCWVLSLHPDRFSQRRGCRRPSSSRAETWTIRH